MRPERFVTYCFLYAGVLILAQYTILYPIRLDVATLAQLGVAASILAIGLSRLRSPDLEAKNPGEYGIFTYSMALLCIALTALFFVQLVVL